MDRHSHSLDDVCHSPPPAPLGMALPLDSSHSYTFGLPDVTPNTETSFEHSYYPLLHCGSKPTFYGRRSNNCLSLDTLNDDQILEFILWAGSSLTNCFFIYKWTCVLWKSVTESSYYRIIIQNKKTLHASSKRLWVHRNAIQQPFTE